MLSNPEKRGPVAGLLRLLADILHYASKIADAHPLVIAHTPLDHDVRTRR